MVNSTDPDKQLYNAQFRQYQVVNDTNDDELLHKTINIYSNYILASRINNMKLSSQPWSLIRLFKVGLPYQTSLYYYKNKVFMSAINVYFKCAHTRIC